MKLGRGIRICKAGAWLGFLVVAACSGAVQTSTEVENEVSARVVRGVAMDSVAMDSAVWMAWDSTGTLVAKGVTDSVGGFSGLLLPQPVGGLQVWVFGRGDTLRALLPLDTSVVKSGVATILVHGLTEAAFPPEIGEPSRGFGGAWPWESCRRGQRLMDSVLGVPLPWSEVAYDPAFRAVVAWKGGVSTPLSGLVRAVEVRAARDGESGPQWLANRSDQPGARLAQDSLFELDLVVSMAMLRLPQQMTGEFVRRLDDAAGHGGVWESAWTDRQIMSGPNELAAKVPWASKPENLTLWQRLVEVTGDQSATYENQLPPAIRPLVLPGRSHEILAEAVGMLIVPDSLSNLPSGRAALNQLLERMVPQAILLLDQMQPGIWGRPPPRYGGSGSQVRDDLPKLLALALQAGLAADWSYGLFQGQPDPAVWLDVRYHELGSPIEASELLRAIRVRHPELGLPSDLIK